MAQEEQEMACEILAYLAEHPDAQDTLEGIAGWWLLERAIKQQMPLVQKALANLVEQNLILPHKGADTQTRYGINPRKRNEISKLLGVELSP